MSVKGPYNLNNINQTNENIPPPGMDFGEFGGLELDVPEMLSETQEKYSNAVCGDLTNRVSDSVESPNLNKSSAVNELFLANQLFSPLNNKLSGSKTEKPENFTSPSSNQTPSEKIQSVVNPLMQKINPFNKIHSGKEVKFAADVALNHVKELINCFTNKSYEPGCWAYLEKKDGIYEAKLVEGYDKNLHENIRLGKAVPFDIINKRLFINNSHREHFKQFRFTVNEDASDSLKKHLETLNNSEHPIHFVVLDDAIWDQVQSTMLEIADKLQSAPSDKTKEARVSFFIDHKVTHVMQYVKNNNYISSTLAGVKDLVVKFLSEVFFGNDSNIEEGRRHAHQEEKRERERLKTEDEINKGLKRAGVNREKVKEQLESAEVVATKIKREVIKDQSVS